MAPPLTWSTNSKPAAARQRLDAQEHFAELPGAAGLLLVPVVAFGRRGDGFAVGDARRPRGHLAAVHLGQAIQQGAQVQLAQAVDHAFVGRRHMLQPQAGVFADQLLQDVVQPLLVAAPLGLDRQAVHRHREVQRLQVDVVVLGRVVQHGVEMQLLDLGDGAQVARVGARHLDEFLALQHAAGGRP